MSYTPSPYDFVCPTCGNKINAGKLSWTAPGDKAAVIVSVNPLCTNHVGWQPEMKVQHHPDET